MSQQERAYKELRYTSELLARTEPESHARMRAIADLNFAYVKALEAGCHPREVSAGIIPETLAKVWWLAWRKHYAKVHKAPWPPEPEEWHGGQEPEPEDAPPPPQDEALF